MIKLEHTVLASPEQMEFIIEGMRNPMKTEMVSYCFEFMCEKNYGGFIFYRK